MGANGSSQQTFKALGPLSIDKYKEYVPKPKNRPSQSQQLQNQNENQQNQAVSEIQQRQQQKQEKQDQLKQKPSQNQKQPEVKSQTKEQNQVEQKPQPPTQVKPQNNNPQVKQQEVLQQQKVQNQKEEVKQLKQNPQKVEQQQEVKHITQEQQIKQIQTQEKKEEKQQVINQAPQTKIIEKRIQQQIYAYKRRSNWNLIVNWDKIASYLRARELVKLVLLSKNIRKQVKFSVSYQSAQSKYLEGTNYGDSIGEEEEGEEEEIEEIEYNETISPQTEERIKIEQSYSPELKRSAIDTIQDQIRGSAVNKPVTNSFQKNESAFKKAQTLVKLTTIKETLRETSEIDSIDKKDRERGNQNVNEEEIININNNKEKTLEEVLETESISIYTETEGVSFENSLHNDRIADLQGKTKSQGNTMIITDHYNAENDNRYQQKQNKDDSSNAASNLNYMMKTLPSNAENPMLSLKFNEDLVNEKGYIKDLKGLNQGQDIGLSDYQSKNKEVYLKPSYQKAHSSMHLNSETLDQRDNIQQTAAFKKQISEVQDTRLQQMNAYIPKHLNSPPKMHLKETLQYKHAIPTPTIRIFEEVDKSSKNQSSLKETGGAPLDNSITSQNGPPKVEPGETSPKLGNQSSSQRNISQFPGGKKISQLDSQIENEQKAKEIAYKQFKEIYEKRIHQQKQISLEAQQKAVKAIELQKPITSQKNRMVDSTGSMIDNTQSQMIGNLPQIQQKSNYVNAETQSEHQNSIQDLNYKPQRSQLPSLKKAVHFEEQLQELKDDLMKFKIQEQVKLPVIFQKSTITEDPSGAYAFSSDVQDLKDLAVLREQALSGANYKRSRSGEKLSLLRIEMRKKQLAENSLREIQLQQQAYIQNTINQSKFSRSSRMGYNSLMDNSINQRDTVPSPNFGNTLNTSMSGQSVGLRMSFNNQSRNFNKMSENQTAPQQMLPKSAMLESINRQLYSHAYANPQIFKNLLMKFLCDGATNEVQQLFSGAPEDDYKFRSSEQFYFAMFHQQVDHNKETKLISPIAVAVNVGDPQLLEILLKNLTDINIEFGIERRRKSQAVLKQNLISSVRKTSPLQFACSLGLHRIVEILLLNGANPNNVPSNERLSMIDYHVNPLVICMNPKYHDKDLEIEGLAYKRKFDQYNTNEVNHELCMMALLRNKGDPNVELVGKRKRPRPIFHAVEQPFKVLKRLMDSIVDRPRVVNQYNAYQETPLCIVAAEKNQADNDQKAKLLIENGASCFAGDLNPLHIAIKNKNYKVMRVLYRQGDASPNRNIADEKSPLEMAILQNDSNLVRELLHWKELQNSLGDFFNARDENGRNIMHVIADLQGVEVFKSLVSETKHKYLREMKQALNQTLDPNQTWLTPLAFCYPNLELAKLYVRYGAEPSRLSFIQQFFSHAKFGEGMQDIDSQGLDRPFFDYLVKELQVNVNEVDAHGKDAVAYCYEAYRKDYLSFLVSGLGASLDQATMPNGRTVLLDAAMRGHIDLFEFLLMKGANPQARDQIGKSAVEYIKSEYATVTNAPKTGLIKDRMSQILYKYHLSRPFKQMAPPIQKQLFPNQQYSGQQRN